MQLLDSSFAHYQLRAGPPATEAVKKLLDQNITQVTEIRRLGRGQSIGSRCDRFNAPPPQVSEASSSNLLLSYFFKGTTPSCCNKVRLSSRCQSSTILPPRTCNMSMAKNLTGLLV